jgi:hypothetical protein
MSPLNTFWHLTARAIVAHPRLVQWLIQRAQRTPYQHITSADGSSVYMGRWWLFNPYPHGSDGDGRRWAWLPSVRIHHIMRADQDRDHHDHPWNARTIILKGYYIEEREGQRFDRIPGDTARLNFGQYHRIAEVSVGGVWTLFICGKKRGTWGFLVDGAKVPWREYLKLEEKKP